MTKAFFAVSAAMILLLHACSSESSVQEQQIPPTELSEELIPLEEGVYYGKIISTKSTLLTYLAVPEAAYAYEDGIVLELDRLDGYITISTAAISIAPILDESFEYGFYDYRMARHENQLELTYTVFVERDTFDTSSLRFNDSCLTRNMTFSISEKSHMTILTDSLLVIELRKKQ